MDVSIIIVNYNTKELTYDCIRSILEKTSEVSFEIILVDNNSHDGSVPFFRNLTDVHLIESKKNLGFGRANNLGFQTARGKYIFLLNSDTILLNNAVKEFYNLMEILPANVACLGTKLLSLDGSENHSYGDFPSLKTLIDGLLRMFKPLGHKTKKKNSDSIIDVDYIIGADLFIRRQVIEKHGFFDPDFFMYFEETELQLRYNQRGYTSKIISSPKIIHLEGGSDTCSEYSFSARMRYLTSMIIYYHKRYSILKYFIARILMIGYYPLFFSNQFSIQENFKILTKLIGSKKFDSLLNKCLI